MTSNTISIFRQILIYIILLIGIQSILKAHGTVTSPPSRIWTCFQEGPENPHSPACIDAVASHGTQPLYDWAGINQGFANGNHQALVPNGNLASGGTPDKYGGMDQVRSDWLATDVTAGPFTITWNNSAPHATEYFRVYITTANWSPDQPLSWDMLELLIETPPSVPEAAVDIDVQLPIRTGHHVIFSVWQRSDSQEAFYSASDINYGDSEPPVNETAKVFIEDDLEVKNNVRVNSILKVGDQVVFQQDSVDKFNISYDDDSGKLSIMEIGTGIAFEIKEGEIFLPQYIGPNERLLGVNTQGKIIEANTAISDITGSIHEYGKFDFSNSEISSGFKTSNTSVHFTDGITLQGLSCYLLNNNLQSGSENNSVSVQLLRQNKVNNALSAEVIFEVVAATTASQVFTHFSNTNVVTLASDIVDNETYVYYLEVRYCSNCDFRQITILK